MPKSDIHRFPLPTPFRVGAINAYLIEGSPLTLIDTGPLWPDSLAALEAGLAEADYAIEDIELVLLTHQHCDHVGLAAEIKRRSGARIGGLSQLAGFMAQWPASIESEDTFASNVMRRYGTEEDRIEAIRAISQSYWGYAEPVELDVLLGDGDEVVAGDRTLRVLTRPGHSPSDTVFVDADTGTGFTGDHLLTRISSNPVIHRPPSGSMDAADREATLVRYLESLAETQALGLREILPGHGDPGDDPYGLISTLTGHHQKRKEAIGELIRDGATTVPALSAALWGRVEASQIYLAVSEVLGHTDLLLREGRLRESDGPGMVVFDLV